MGFKSAKVPQTTQQGPARHLQMQQSALGQPIPLVYGEARVASNIVWAAFFTAANVEGKGPQGAKKGGRASTSVQYVYTVSVLFALGEGALSGDTQVLTIGRATPGAQVISVSETDGHKTQNPQPAHGVDPGIWRAKRIRALTTGDQAVITVDRVKVHTSHFHNYGTVDAPRWLTAPGDVVALTFNNYRSWRSPAPPGSSYRTPKQRNKYIEKWNDNYPGVALAGIQNLHLGSNASIPNTNFPYRGLQRCSQIYGYTGIEDADPASIAADLLTNPKHGGGWDRPPGVAIGAARDYRRLLADYDPVFEDAGGSPFWGGGLVSPPANSWSAYCRAHNILVSPVYDAQRPLAEILQELAMLSNTAIVWSEGVLKMIPYGDQASASANTTVAFAPADDPDVYTTGANPTVRYDLTVADFLPGANGDPVEVLRKAIVEDQSSAGFYNKVTVECVEADNAYATLPVEAPDEASIQERGLYAHDSISLHAITNSPLALDVADRLLERAETIRNIYRFKLGWQFCLLEPMDVVTLTEPGVALDHARVRIVSIDENAEGALEMEAESYPLGRPGRDRPAPPEATDFAVDAGGVIWGSTVLADGQGAITQYDPQGLESDYNQLPDAQQGTTWPPAAAVVMPLDITVTSLVAYTMYSVSYGDAGSPVKPVRLRVRLNVAGASRPELELWFEPKQYLITKRTTGAIPIAAGTPFTVELAYIDTSGGVTAWALTAPYMDSFAVHWGIGWDLA